MSEGSEDLYKEDEDDEEELKSEADDFEVFFHDVVQGIRAAGWQAKFNPSMPEGWTSFFDALEAVVDQHFYRK